MNVELKKYKIILIFMAVFSVLSTAVVLGVYFFKFHGSLSSSSEEFSRFGGYIGGSLTPILSFSTIVTLIITVFLQIISTEISNKNLEIAFKSIVDQNDKYHISNKKENLLLIFRMISDDLDRYLLLPITEAMQCGYVDYDILNKSFDFYLINFYPNKELSIDATEVVEKIFILINKLQGYLKIYDELFPPDLESDSMLSDYYRLKYLKIIEKSTNAT